MTEYLDYLKDYLQEQGIPWTPMTVIVLAVLLALVFLLVFLTLRFLWDLIVGSDEPKEETLESLLESSQKPSGLFSDLDNAFDSLMERTGLGLSPIQGACWILLGGVAAAIAGYVPRQELWQSGLAFIGGTIVVLTILIWHAVRHRRLVQSQLPDALFMLARSTRAGQNLEQALHLVGHEGGAAIAPEFRRCAAQIRLGLPIVTALQNMAARLNLLDVNALVSAVALHETTGGNLPMLLDRLASSARDRNHFHGFIRSATALGRLSAFAIALMTPGILIVYCYYQPNYAQTMLQTRIGLTMIGTALGLEIIGIIWLYRLLKIET